MFFYLWDQMSSPNFVLPSTNFSLSLSLFSTTPCSSDGEPFRAFNDTNSPWWNPRHRLSTSATRFYHKLSSSWHSIHFLFLNEELNSGLCICQVGPVPRSYIPSPIHSCSILIYSFKHLKFCFAVLGTWVQDHVHTGQAIYTELHSQHWSSTSMYPQ